MKNNLKKYIKLIFFLLFLYSSQTLANWESLADGPGGESYYIDNSTLTKGDFAKVNVLTDYKKNGDFGEKSIEKVWQANCIDLKIRVTSQIGYRKNMAKGEPFFLNNSPFL